MIFLLIRYFVSILLLIAFSSFAIILGLFRAEWAYRTYSRCCRLVLSVLGIELIVDSSEAINNEGPYVFLGLNQESPLETLLWPAAVPVYARYILNLEFALLPFVGWSFWSMRNFIILRQWKSHAKRTLDEKVVRYLKGGRDRSLCVHLDGYMKSNDTLGPFKKGGIITAVKSKAKIVPVAVHGAKECLKRGDFLLRRGSVRVHFLKSLDMSLRSLEETDAILEELKQIAVREFPGKTVL